MEVIDAFIPAGMAPTAWYRLRPIVRQVVLSAGPRSRSQAERMMSIVAGLTVWAERQGLALRPNVVLHPDTIDRYVLDGCSSLSPRTRSNYHSVLRGIGAAVLGPPLYPAPHRQFGRTDPSRPYSPHELSAIVGWLRGLPTPMMQENALILVSASTGAGLFSHEISRATGSDVVDLGDES